jgi:diphosphomevalonate decarboxylase
MNSYAFSIAAASHWDLVDCIAIISQAQKSVSSQDGHLLAATSLLQPTRTADAPHRLANCREAIRQRDFDALAQVVELDSNLMHAVMMTSIPPLLYWLPATIRIMQTVLLWRKRGLPCFYTIDAGPNVHVLSPEPYFQQVADLLIEIEGVERVMTAHPGGPARWLPGES